MAHDSVRESTDDGRRPTGPLSIESIASKFGDQRRLTWRLLAYWEQLRGERDFPRLKDVDPVAIESLWPYCFVLDVASFRAFPFFRYLGPALAKYSGLYLAGPDDESTTLLMQAVRHYQEALQRGAPVLVEEDLTQYDNSKLSFSSVLLPLSDDQTTINYLLGAASGTLRRT